MLESYNDDAVSSMHICIYFIHMCIYLENIYILEMNSFQYKKYHFIILHITAYHSLDLFVLIEI